MMMTQIKKRTFVVVATLAIGFVAVKLAEAQLPGATSTPTSSRFRFDDMVTTGKSELGGERVGVNVPGIVNLKVDRRPSNGGARLKLTVLSGLVSVSLDRVHHEDGTREGPIDVRVFGVPVYRNQAARDGTVPREPNPLSNFASSLTNSMTNTPSSILPSLDSTI